MVILFGLDFITFDKTKITIFFLSCLASKLWCIDRNEFGDSPKTSNRRIGKIFVAKLDRFDFWNLTPKIGQISNKLLLIRSVFEFENQLGIYCKLDLETTIFAFILIKAFSPNFRKFSFDRTKLAACCTTPIARTWRWKFTRASTSTRPVTSTTITTTMPKNWWVLQICLCIENLR